MSVALVKAAIKTNLDALVSADVLAGATTQQFKQNPLLAEVSTFPHAFLQPPAIESEVLDNRTITRTHTFDIVIIFQGEDITDVASLEGNIESVLTQFDNDPTLGGTALGGVLPVSSAPEPFNHKGKDRVMVVLQIIAKEIVSLSFS